MLAENQKSIMSWKDIRKIFISPLQIETLQLELIVGHSLPVSYPRIKAPEPQIRWNGDVLLHICGLNTTSSYYLPADFLKVVQETFLPPANNLMSSTLLGKVGGSHTTVNFLCSPCVCACTKIRPRPAKLNHSVYLV